MTPADRRILEQIDRWLASIDQHMKYLSLSDADYRKVQAWPPHDRPTRWILEVGRQKILELKAQIDSRSSMGDSKFAEALELMAFVATLVGVQNLQRFIPQAGAESVAPPAPPSNTTTQQTLQTIIQPTRESPPSKGAGDEPTREMPRIPVRTASAPALAKMPAAKPAPAKPAVAPKPAVEESPTLIPQRRETKKPAAKQAAKAPEGKSAAPQDPQSLVVADAVRLIKWGKEWHELAELIGRIADRPPLPEIRKILRNNRQRIEAQANERA
jgi:hypothetical protein